MTDFADRVREQFEPVLDNLRSTLDTLLHRASDEDRPLIERALRRAGELQTALLIDPENDDARDELRSVVNTLQFVRARYQIDAASAVSEFVRKVFDRLIATALTAALAA